MYDKVEKQKNIFGHADVRVDVCWMKTQGVICIVDMWMK